MAQSALLPPPPRPCNGVLPTRQEQEATLMRVAVIKSSHYKLLTATLSRLGPQGKTP